MTVSEADKQQLNIEVANEICSELYGVDFVKMFYDIISDAAGSLEEAKASFDDEYFMRDMVEEAQEKLLITVQNIFERWLERAEVTVTIKL